MSFPRAHPLNTHLYHARNSPLIQEHTLSTPSPCTEVPSPRAHPLNTHLYHARNSPLQEHTLSTLTFTMHGTPLSSKSTPSQHSPSPCTELPSPRAHPLNTHLHHARNSPLIQEHTLSTLTFTMHGTPLSKSTPSQHSPSPCTELPSHPRAHPLNTHLHHARNSPLIQEHTLSTLTFTMHGTPLSSKSTPSQHSPSPCTELPSHPRAHPLNTHLHHARNSPLIQEHTLSILTFTMHGTPLSSGRGKFKVGCDSKLETPVGGEAGCWRSTPRLHTLTAVTHWCRLTAVVGLLCVVC